MNTKVTVASGIQARCAKLVDLSNESALKRTAPAASMLAAGLLFAAGTAIAQLGSTYRTPDVPMELPIEVEIELSPAGSLKQAPLWKELYKLLKNPYAVSCPNPDPNACIATIERRPGFGVTMPPLNIYSIGYNFLTGQPMRMRTSDGEASWDQPGPLFDRDQSCLEPGTLGCDALNTPTELRTVIGHLVACPNVPAYQAVRCSGTTSAMASPGTAAWSSTTPPASDQSRRPVPSSQSTFTSMASCTNLTRRPASSRRSTNSKRRSTRKTSSVRRPIPRGSPLRCGRISAGMRPRFSERRCSGTCRWEATACKPVVPAIFTPVSTIARAVNSTRIPWAALIGHCRSRDRTWTSSRATSRSRSATQTRPATARRTAACRWAWCLPAPGQ